MGGGGGGGREEAGRRGYESVEAKREEKVTRKGERTVYVQVWASSWSWAGVVKRLQWFPFPNHLHYFYSTFWI